MKKTIGTKIYNSKNEYLEIIGYNKSNTKYKVTQVTRYFNSEEEQGFQKTYMGYCDESMLEYLIKTLKKEK